MAGSRRRLKKTRSKVKVGVNKYTKKTEKSKLPLELSEQRPDVEKRLNVRYYLSVLDPS